MIGVLYDNALKVTNSALAGVEALFAVWRGVRATGEERSGRVEGQGQAKPGSTAPAVGFGARLSGYAAKGLRYWEPRRLIYNAVLTLVVLRHLLLAWPGSREGLSFDLVLGLFLLAVLANVAYCAA